MTTPLVTRGQLDRLYDKLNRRDFLSPDPLQVVYEYPDPADQEIVGLIAAGLAYGRVASILQSIDRVLTVLGPHPHQRLREDPAPLIRELGDFQHRWTTQAEMADLFRGLHELLNQHDSLQALFLKHYRSRHDTVIPALTAFSQAISPNANSLISRPDKGSACKRLHMYMRWMVRSDDIDPGCWPEISPSKLIVPLDTHMFNIAKQLGLTTRNQANLATALEVTAGYAKLRPRDPVRYDFALTRLGIRSDTDLDAWLRRVTGKT